MFSKKRLYQDINQVCSLTDAVYGSYTELHKYDKNGSPVKLLEFINKAQKLMGENAAYYLYAGGILRQQMGGDYDFCFPSDVAEGGGVTVNQLGIKDGKDYRLVLFFDDKTLQDRYNIYHELGHLMQYRFNMFNHKDIRQIYNFMDKGIKAKKTSFGNLTKRFVSANNYQLHLYETHANAFATACMLLRCQNQKELRSQSLDCYLRAGNIFFEGVRDPQKIYPAMKYYSALPVQKATIREVNNWFKTGEINKYKKKNGDIDFGALAFKTREITLKHAYSPRTFSQFLKQKIFASHPSSEQGWRHSVPEAALLWLTRKLYNPDQASLDQRTKRHEQIDLQRRCPAFEPLPEKDEAAKLINMCCQIDNAVVELHNCCETIDIEIENHDEFDLNHAISAGHLPDSVVETVEKRLMFEHGISEEEAQILLKPYQDNINKILSKEYDTDAVLSIMDFMNTTNGRNQIWEMYYQKNADPETEIAPLDIVEKQEKPSKKEILKKEVKCFKDIRNIITDTLCQSVPNSEKTNFSEVQRFVIDNIATEAFYKNNRAIGKQALNLAQQRIPQLKKQQPAQRFCEEIDKLYCLYFTKPDIFAQTVQKYRKDLYRSCGLSDKKIVINHNTFER